ncbi:hypothetical protein [Bacillus sp. 1NLA3E]|uniref:hypothetical protein n=1 Tax=Bacillus sp. 1NLA3E TaxID=666686 RepID=UPI000247ECC4|nr:hypothetical protein [Bacillus sp. 1NLA3E]AGK54233.1 hypothetical protein B1NLA3E_12425 [Bacillus sp. 1NLA3E]
MGFPVIHTNFWDAVIAVPVIIIVTQIIKILAKVPKIYVPTISVVIGLIISIFISHRGHFTTGIFMGFFYGYAAIGSYSSLKTSIIYFRQEKD